MGAEGATAPSAPLRPRPSLALVLPPSRIERGPACRPRGSPTHGIATRRRARRATPERVRGSARTRGPPGARMSAQTAMPARTGKEFLQGLKDERQIWVGEERVRDVATHPALAGAARFVASLYDLQHEAAQACLMPDPETGEPINVSHMIPR